MTFYFLFVNNKTQDGMNSLVAFHIEILNLFYGVKNHLTQKQRTD